jgi:hypothetical protein
LNRDFTATRPDDAFRQREEERMWRGNDLGPDKPADVATILNAVLKPRPRR